MALLPPSFRMFPGNRRQLCQLQPRRCLPRRIQHLFRLGQVTRSNGGSDRAIWPIYYCSWSG